MKKIYIKIIIGFVIITIITILILSFQSVLPVSIITTILLNFSEAFIAFIPLFIAFLTLFGLTNFYDVKMLKIKLLREALDTYRAINEINCTSFGKSLNDYTNALVRFNMRSPIGEEYKVDLNQMYENIKENGKQLREMSDQMIKDREKIWVEYKKLSEQFLNE